MSEPSDNLALLARWNRALDPSHALDLSDSEDRKLYVDLDHWIHDGRPEGLRGPPAVVDIVRDIRLVAASFAEESTHLFSGFRGTGKTTELNRLARELEALGDFVVLRIAASDYHHLSDALSVEELALILAAGIGEAALAKLGEMQLGSLAREGVWERITDRLHRAFEGSAVSLKLGPVEVKPALHQGEGLKADLRAALRERPHALRQFLHDFVRDLAAVIHPRQLVVIVDDLEKYSAPTNRIAAVYQDMAELFYHAPDILSLPQCHTIYTVPPYLAFINPGIAEVYGGRLRVLPSVKLRSPPPVREPYQPGIDALEAVLAGRLDLDQLFGEARHECVTQLVGASGGNIRDLFALSRATLRVALGEGLPVGGESVAQVISTYGATRRVMLEGASRILAKVSAGGRLSSIGRDEFGAFAEAMDQHLLLCYCNGDAWYDVHPLTEPALEGGAPDGAAR